jgi:hypothetical protein
MNTLRGLRSAQRTLEPEEVIDALDRALAGWRAPDSLWRTKLVREHGVYSSEVLERAMAEGLGGWTGEAMRALRAREVREPCWVPPVTAVWLAGSIPTAEFHAMLLPLLAGSALYVKTSSQDPVSARLFAESLQALNPRVAEAVSVGDDPTLLEMADAIVAHGSDETIAAIRARVPAQRIFIGYGHKLSLAVVGPDVELDEAAEAAGLDVALYDGRGCLSPAYVGVIDRPRGRAAAFATALADVLQRLATELPRGHLNASEEAAIRYLRARAALREGVRLEMPEHGTAWTVMIEPAGSRPPPGLLRCIPVIPLSDASELELWCDELAPHLSSLGHAGWGGPSAELTQAVGVGGGSRVCPLGRMQFPPLDWSHDGTNPIRSLLRLIDVERD